MKAEPLWAELMTHGGVAFSKAEELSISESAAMATRKDRFTVNVEVKSDFLSQE